MIGGDGVTKYECTYSKLARSRGNFFCNGWRDVAQAGVSSSQILLAKPVIDDDMAYVISSSSNNRLCGTLPSLTLEKFIDFTT